MAQQKGRGAGDVLVLVGTAKGAFVVRSDKKRTTCVSSTGWRHR
jgi:hypothetical protein